MGFSRMLFLITLILYWVSSESIFASYRVYKLRVTQFSYNGQKRGSRIEMSTLDSYQYEHLNGGYRWTRVEMLDTWYCPGDTSHKKYCKKPKELRPRQPASLEHPKRSPLPYNLQPVIP